MTSHPGAQVSSGQAALLTPNAAASVAPAPTAATAAGLTAPQAPHAAMPGSIQMARMPGGVSTPMSSVPSAAITAAPALPTMPLRLPIRPGAWKSLE